MATDNLDAQLASFEDKLPTTPEPGDDDYVHQQLDEGAETTVADDDDDSAGEIAEQSKGGDQKSAEAKGADDKAKTATAKDDEDAAAIKQRADNMSTALSKERAQRRAIENQLQEQAQSYQRMQQEMAKLQQQIRASQFQAPDPDTDIIGSMKYLQAQLDAQRQTEARQQQQAQEQHQQSTRVQNLMRTVDDFESEFAETHPDYHEAADWLVDMQEQMLTSAGYAPAVAKQGAINWAMNMAQGMLNNRQNPAQVAYDQAVKMGFKPKAALEAAQAAAEQQRQAQANGKAKIDNAKAGQKAGSPMSGGGQGQAKYDGSIKSILSLEGAAFDKAMDKFLKS